LPTGAGSRLARLGLAGAGVMGRTALGELRKIGAGPERRQAVDDSTRDANARQVFEVLAELKGPALKLGQVLSQQRHELPEAWARRLAALQRSAPPMHGALVRVQIRNELGRPPEDLFDAFEREPFAAASLGQVHRARRGGEELAVKVQYPGIERAIGSDFSILQALLRTAELAVHRPELEPALAEVRQHVEQEVDYVQEADALELFGRHLESEEDVRVPRVVRELSGRRVLTMERLEGFHVEELLRAGVPQAEHDRLATRLLDLFFRQTMVLGVFQADSHPGNFLFLPDGRIGLLDLGCTKRLPPDLVREHRRLFLLPLDDDAALTEQFIRLRLFDPEEERARERLSLLLRMQRLDVPMYQSDQAFDFADGAWLRDLSLCLRDALRAGLTHPELVLYMRAKLGLYSLFHQLGARVRCHRVLRAYL